MQKSINGNPFYDYYVIKPEASGSEINSIAPGIPGQVLRIVSLSGEEGVTLQASNSILI